MGKFRRYTVEKDVPFLDLGEAILRRYSQLELRVHAIDGHPNEMAHRAAAEMLFEFLRAEGLVWATEEIRNRKLASGTNSPRERLIQ